MRAPGASAPTSPAPAIGLGGPCWPRPGGGWGGGAEGTRLPRLDSALGRLLTLLVCAIRFPALRAPAGASSPPEGLPRPRGSGCPQPGLSVTRISSVLGERVLAFGLPAAPLSRPAPEMLGSLCVSPASQPPAPALKISGLCCPVDCCC